MACARAAAGDRELFLGELSTGYLAAVRLDVVGFYSSKIGKHDHKTPLLQNQLLGPKLSVNVSHHSPPAAHPCPMLHGSTGKKISPTERDHHLSCYLVTGFSNLPLHGQYIQSSDSSHIAMAKDHLFFTAERSTNRSGYCDRS